MSPIIFLLTFNPIIQLVRRLECPGFFFKIPKPNSENLPSEGSTIYITWDEANSNEDSGWYRCVVTKYLPDGKAEVTYPNSSIEMLDLNSVNWTFARKNSKRFLPLSTQPPSFTPSHAKGRKDTRTYQSREHKVKAFADDLTIITSNYSDHKKTLCSIDSHCLEVDLMLRPEKCITMSYTGSQFDTKASVHLSGGSTVNIIKKPAKMLGRLIKQSNRSTCSQASQQLLSHFKVCLENLNSRPIRGEYKLWTLFSYINEFLPSREWYFKISSKKDGVNGN